MARLPRVCALTGACTRGCLQVYGYALFKAGKWAGVEYPKEGFAEDVAGRSFHHGRFVQRLRMAAAAMPSVTMREGFVRRLVNGEQGVVGAAACSSLEQLRCHACSGHARVMCSLHAR